MRFKPMNRHLLVETLDKDAEDEAGEYGIVLPDSYKPKQEAYVPVRLIGFANDCNSVGDLVENSIFLVEASMINELKFDNETFEVILENYVLGKIAN